ncbi:PilZ domain protein [bacterium BMS3Bbin14]|nr:PilZ domain protein [bacterium BMS3Abin13]GBE52417.1 PilZ domain protein [bacterium BMS3Bbin14]HDK43696.1 PilZ domain-containing protein [Desulfobacteraceae bacterium]HDO31087.1 PilZ domain-containing protein [Desulfobacteraceae bacterium]
METVKIFVRPDNTVTIVCPSCSLVKNASVGAYKDKCHNIKVRCPCGTQFMVHLDFRRYFRKPTDLPGFYKIVKPPGMGCGDINIKDISLGGIGFTVSGKNRIEVGQTLSLDFTLDDKKKTRLKKEVAVQSIDGDFIGSRFSDNELFEKELGFYLRF